MKTRLRKSAACAALVAPRTAAAAPTLSDVRPVIPAKQAFEALTKSICAHVGK